MLNLWRNLTDGDVKEFTEWVDENFKVGDAINQTWHPIIQCLCHRKSAEYWENIADELDDV